MQRMSGRWFSKRFSAAILVLFASPSVAKYMNVWEPVPLERLIRNQDAKLRANPKDAKTIYLLGRLHGLGFIRGEKTVNYDKADKYDFPPYDRIREERTVKGPPKAAAAMHLRKSIRLYSQATQLAPNNAIYQLGLGWMLLQGAPYAETIDWPLGRPGEKQPREHWVRQSAIALRRAFDLSEMSDLARQFGGDEGEGSVSLEAGESLLKLYQKDLANDRDDVQQRKRIQKTVQALHDKPRFITPIVFPLDRRSSLTSLIDTSKRVRFDLAGDTRSERWPWLRPTVALLVWDPQHIGKITSGRQLFGSRTWQMFWRHGYQPLAALDDDRSGMLTGKELIGLSAWIDRNGNAISEPGEVVPVSKLGITAILVNPAGRQGSVWFHPAGLRYSDGGSGPTYDWTPTSVGR